MKIQKKKKKNFFFFFFGDWDFFFKLGKKSPKSHWERGRNSAPEDTKKNPCAREHGEKIENKQKVAKIRSKMSRAYLFFVKTNVYNR